MNEIQPQSPGDISLHARYQEPKSVGLFSRAHHFQINNSRFYDVHQGIHYHDDRKGKTSENCLPSGSTTVLIASRSS